MRFLPVVLALCLLTPVWAQEPVAETAPPAAPARWEGTLTQSSDGVTARAKLFWQAPDALKIEVQPDVVNGVPAQIVIAKGDITSLYEPATRRLSVLRYNVAKEWWRDWNLQSGGPANFAFAGTTPPAKAPRVWHRDAVVFGGGGDRAFYAAYKTPLPLWPQIELTGSPAAVRREKDLKGQVTAEIALEWSPAKLPIKATATVRGVQTVFEYALQAHAEAFPADTFELPAGAKDAIPEDHELLAPTAYIGTTAAALWNRGAALAEGAEDCRGALQAWDEAAKVNSAATAPWLSSFEVALTMRDLPSAQNAYDHLAALKLDSAELAVRQARLALARRDYTLALGSIASARQAAPGNAEFALLHAQILRVNGDADGSQRVLVELLGTKIPPAQGVEAAQALAIVAAPEVLATLPAENENQKLARVLLQIREMQAPDAVDFTDDDAQAVFAGALERAALEARAQAAWTVLQGRPSLDSKTEARAHLAALAARRGNVEVSLAAFKDALADLYTESERIDARAAFFDAWQKSNQMQVLYRALQNRAQARAATNEDLRLWVAWQEAYGTPDDIKTAAMAGRARFPADAFWLAKNAEISVAQANDQRGTELGLAKRNSLYREAMDYLDKAIAAEPDQPFYVMQRALVALQRATPHTGVSDASRIVIDTTAAKQILTAMLKDRPDDPDIAAAVAVGRLALNDKEPAMTAAASVLDSAPGDGDRHTLVLAARQTLAKGLRKVDNTPATVQQYDALMLAANSPTEEAGLANVLLNYLVEQDDAPGAAALLTRIAGESWNYSAARSLLDGLSGRVANVPTFGPATVVALRTYPRPAARLAEAALSQQLFEVAEEAINLPGAPPTADAEYERATKFRSESLKKLAVVATGDDPLLAGRAAAALAENTTNTDASKWMRQAVASEPTDPALRFTLADSLIAAKDMDAAKRERDIASRLLAWNSENGRGLALLSLRVNDQGVAWKIAQRAYNEALISPDVDANAFQRIAFAAARVAFATNQIERGAEIYNGLTTPQWTRLDQATALLALRFEWQSLNRDDEVKKLQPRIDALQLTDDDRKVITAFLESLAN